MNRKQLVRLPLLVILTVFLAGSTSYAQSLQTGLFSLEEQLRRMELRGERTDSSTLMIRPLQFIQGKAYDSIYQQLTGIGSAKRVLYEKGNNRLSLLPVALTQQFTPSHAFGWNDGSLYPSKGYQVKATAGIHARWGVLSVQLQPELVFNSNNAAPGFSAAHSDSAWYYYYEYQNWIDKPERFGNKSFARFFPGQSSIRINYKGMSVGASSENLWWGPGTRNALVMSNNAPGFYHLTFNSTRPHKTFLGKFEWQLISGLLENSGMLPPDTARRFNGLPLYQPKTNSNRYINAMVVNWQPKWVAGLELGFIRSFFQYTSNLQGGLNGYLPIFSAFFKGNAQDENRFGRDQLISFYFRWKFNKEQAEIYGEWGRNDHAANLTDFIQEPEHSRAYTLGIRKLFLRPNKKWDMEFFTELTHLQTPTTILVRAVQPWYAHYQVRHGYTHKGQVLGAGIGPGSSSQSVGLNWVQKNLNKTGLLLERIVYNNDFYYKAFSNLQSFEGHWVDIALTGTKTWQRNRLLYTANASLIRTYNYQWRMKKLPATLDGGRENINQVQLGLTLGYIF